MKYTVHEIVRETLNASESFEERTVPKYLFLVP